MISFIIPAFNEEKTISKTLESILKQQTSEAFEIIVVDNGSTDHTVQIVAQNFPAVKLVKEECQGTTWARNRGAQEARGEILVFFDADIVAPPDWTGKMLRYFNITSLVAAIGGPYIYLGLNSWQRFWQWIWYRIGILPTRWFFCDFLKISSILFGGNFAVRKKVFDLIGGFDTKFTFWGDDTDLAKRLLKIGKVWFKMDLAVYSTTRGLRDPNKSFLENFWIGFKSAIIYGLNFYWVTFFNRPFSKKIKVVR